MKHVLIAFTLILLSLNSFTQTNWMKKKAPEIVVDKWVNNNKSHNNLSIKSSKKSDIVYIILEFWAPDIAPAVGNIPLLNEIAKEFNNVQILAVTYQNEEKVNKFLEGIELNYPIGIDTRHQTIKNFQIRGYPSTFIIDRNGVVIWQDDFHYQSLNKFQLREILNGAQGNISKIDGELDKEEEIYSFKIKDHTLNMGKASYYESSPYLVSVVNKDMEELLKMFFHINKSRIMDYDSTFLKKKYDITFQASKNIPLENNCVEAIKYLLPKELKFQPRSINKDTTLFTINIINDSLLNTHLSQRKQWGGNSLTNEEWIGKGARFQNIKDYLENQFNMLIEVDTPDTVNYDFVLSLTSMDKNIKILREQYGVELVEKQGCIEMWEIIK